MSIAKTISDSEGIIRKGLILASDKYIKEGRVQLIVQGHKASGRLDKSFEAEVKGGFASLIEVGISFNDYGMSLETGVPANNVRYPISAMIPWAKIKMPGKSISELKSFLWASRTMHQIEGIGTRASRRFSLNGKRTGWLSDTIKNIEKAEELIDFEKAIQILVDGIAERFK